MQRFPALNPEKTIVILPVATIVQRRPHLPVMTDSAIGEAMLAGLQIRLPAERRCWYGRSRRSESRTNICCRGAP
jgi:creatinine amidohydrolase/Fe(II)-dependent formamide hydrolase-like protein